MEEASTEPLLLAEERLTAETVNNNLKMKKTLLILIPLLSIAILASADVLKGRVVDQQTKEPLEGASVQVTMKRGNNTRMFTTMTDSLGVFCVESEYMNTNLEVSFIGYYEKTRRYVCMEGKDTVRIDDIELMPSEVLLKSVEVKGHARSFVMRGDTVVYNPEAFKLKEGERIDKLLELLPGVERKDGELYWRGKPVRLNVNGNNTLSENMISQLPADAVKEIKGYDKKSEYARRSGRDDGEEDNVLDIVIKPGFLERWYGYASLAGLTSGNYKGTLSSTYLSERNPLAVYGRVSDFNDMYEPMGYGSMRGYAGSVMYRQQTGSLAYRHLYEPRFSGWKDLSNVGIESHISHYDERKSSQTNTEYIMDGGTTTLNMSANSSYGHNVRVPVTVSMFHNIGPKTTLRMQADATYEKAATTTTSDNTTTEGFDGETVNKSETVTHGRQETRSAKVRGDMTHYFGKSMVEAEARLGYTDKSGDMTSAARYEYMKDTPLSADEIQQSANHRHDLQAMLKLKGTLAVSGSLSLMPSYSIIHRNDFSYDDRTRDGMHDDNNSYARSTLKTDNTLGLSAAYNLKKLVIRPTFSMTLGSEKARYDRGRLDTVASRQETLLAPSLMTQWKMSRGNAIKLSVSYNESLPDIIQTLAFTDDTDPLNIKEGNPLLKRSSKLSADVTYSMAIPKHEQMFILSAGYTKDYDPTQKVTYYNRETGVFRSHEENTRGGGKWTVSVKYDRALGKYIQWRNTLDGSAGTSYGQLTIIEGAEERQMTCTTNLHLRYQPTMRYTWKGLKLSLVGLFDMSHNEYKEREAESYTLYKYNVTGIGEYETGHWNFMLENTFYGRSGYNTSWFNKKYLVTNASVTYKTLKNNLQVSLSCNDIFNTYNSIGTQETSSYRAETTAYILHNYVQLSLLYTFEAKGGKAKR